MRGRRSGGIWSGAWGRVWFTGCLIVLLALVCSGAVEAADGAVLAADDRGSGAAQNQLSTVVAVPTAGPLTALATGMQSLACVQTPIAVDAAGRRGVLAPQVGVTVIRGAAAPTPALTWVVVPLGEPAGGQATVTVCTPMR